MPNQPKSDQKQLKSEQKKTHFTIKLVMMKLYVGDDDDDNINDGDN